MNKDENVLVSSMLRHCKTKNLKDELVNMTLNFVLYLITLFESHFVT